MEEERTINLRHMLYKVCKGWRLMLAWMLVMALVFTGVSVIQNATATSTKAANDKKIEELTGELTLREQAEVTRALASAAEYVEQRDSILDYLANSYVLKNVMGEVPVTQYRYYFENAVVPTYQFRFLVDEALVPVV